jgi:hypothetical protein
MVMGGFQTHDDLEEEGAMTPRGSSSNTTVGMGRYRSAVWCPGVRCPP